MCEATIPHQAPQTPGWQIMLESARGAISADATRQDVHFFRCNLFARKGEHIPAEHRMEVATAIASLGAKLNTAVWPDEFVEFLDAQLGKEGVRELVAGLPGVEIRECQCEGVGYHITNPLSLRMLVMEAILEIFREAIQVTVSEEE